MKDQGALIYSSDRRVSEIDIREVGAATTRAPDPGDLQVHAHGLRVRDISSLRLVLDPYLPVLRRRGPQVQIGIGTDRSVTVSCPAPLTAEMVAEALRSLDGSVSAQDSVRKISPDHVPRTQLLLLFADLLETGVLTAMPSTTPSTRGHTARRVLVLGDGVFAPRVSETLRGRGWSVARSPSYSHTLHRRLNREPVELVVLCDVVVPDPVFVQRLVAESVPHLHLHCRDGRAVVGPYVIPRTSSCLRCIDLFRADIDSSWPVMAAQLLRNNGQAPDASLTAALALLGAECDSLTRGAPLSLTGVTVEVSPHENRWHSVLWPAHPRCDCGAVGVASEPAPKTNLCHH